MGIVNFKELISVTLILFSIIDIVGSLPVILDMKKRGMVVESGKASLVALVIMTVFLYVGEAILKLFGVDIQSFAVAGAIILFFIGMEMVLGITIFRETDDEEGAKGTIVPIAFPLIAGAGVMTTIVALKAKYDAINIQLGIVLNILFVYLVLRSSNWIGRKLGRGGAGVLRKVFGIILLAIAIKLFKDNFRLVVTPPEAVGG